MTPAPTSTPQGASATTGFAQDGYQVLRGVVPQALCQYLALNYELLVANNYIRFNDGQVERGYAAYGLPATETLLEMLRPAVERATGLALFPTYSYSRVYLKGAVLPPHSDRPACEISCSVTLAADSAAPWPFCLEDKAGNRREFTMAPGDALLYRGPELTHWREAFEGESQIQAFLHYVQQDGPNAHLKFDRRPRLGAPEVKGPRRVQT